MRTQCPRCGHRYDIPERAVVSAAGRINAKRRRKLTSDEAREMQRRSAEVRAAKRDAKIQGKDEL